MQNKKISTHSFQRLIYLILLLCGEIVQINKHVNSSAHIQGVPDFDVNPNRGDSIDLSEKNEKKIYFAFLENYALLRALIKL